MGGARKSPGIARTRIMMSASRLMHVEDFLRTSASLIEIDTRNSTLLKFNNYLPTNIRREIAIVKFFRGRRSLKAITLVERIPINKQ